MSTFGREPRGLPTEQQALRDKCFHPTGTFIEFSKQDLEQSIPDRFEQQVSNYPERLALKSRSHALTYRELNNAANQVAHAIGSIVGEGNRPVLLLFKQNALEIVAFLGVLKTGRPFVPVDPGLPRPRLNFILEHTQASLIVTDECTRFMAEELTHNRIPVISIDVLDSSLTISNPNLRLTPDSIAVILYTSGSTGQPKGVVHSHSNILQLARNHTNIFHICAEDRINRLYPLGAIGGIRDTLGALLNGGAVFPFDLKEENFDNLAEWLIQEHLTTYRSAATVFRRFVETLTERKRFPDLRLVQLGNEKVYPKDVESFKKHFSSDSSLFVALGTTEISHITELFVDTHSSMTEGFLPVGYPAEGIEVFLLDEDGKEVGPGQVGEIAVKGDYLAMGYWRRQDLTNAKFFAGPAGGRERIYLTGDLGQLRSDGCLIHLGRKDFQVKIRGYNVETEEVETALINLNNVKESAVQTKEGRQGDQILVAYVVPVEAPSPSVTILRRQLSEALPDYMIPAAFVILDALPLLPNGKVNRQALPDPDWTRPDLENDFRAPQTPGEVALANIWSEVLSIDEVGIDDNFLDLGGNSLLAGQVISRAIQNFRVDLPLRFLFEAPTVVDMATAIIQHSVKAADPLDIERMLQELEPRP